MALKIRLPDGQLVAPGDLITYTPFDQDKELEGYVTEIVVSVHGITILIDGENGPAHIECKPIEVGQPQVH